MKEIESKSDLEILLTKNEYTFLLFYADWCMLGRSLLQLIEPIEKKFQKEVIFAKINIEKHKGLTGAYKIISLPTIIMFKQKKIKQKLIGLQSKKKVENTLNKILSIDEEDAK